MPWSVPAAGSVTCGGVWAPGGLPGLQNRGTAHCAVGGFDSRPPPLTCADTVLRLSLRCARSGPDLRRGNTWVTLAHDPAPSTSRAPASAPAWCAACSLWVYREVIAWSAGPGVL